MGKGKPPRQKHERMLTTCSGDTRVSEKLARCDTRSFKRPRAVGSAAGLSHGALLENLNSTGCHHVAFLPPTFYVNRGREQELHCVLPGWRNYGDPAALVFSKFCGMAPLLSSVGWRRTIEGHFLERGAGHVCRQTSKWGVVASAPDAAAPTWAQKGSRSAVTVQPSTDAPASWPECGHGHWLPQRLSPAPHVDHTRGSGKQQDCPDRWALTERHARNKHRVRRPLRTRSRGRHTLAVLPAYGPS